MLRRGQARWLLAGASILALGAQVAALADALFVAHVTCPADGERIHARPDATGAAAEPWASATSGTIAADEHAHGQCLIDDDAECPAPSSETALAVPLVTRLAAPLARAPRRLPGPPLYRLAPKNSPPAQGA